MTTNRIDVIMVIIAVAIIAISGEWGTIYLIAHHIDASAVSLIVAITTGATGYLGGVLSSTGPRPPTGTIADPVTTTVANDRTDPIPTQQVPTGPVPGQTVGEIMMQAAPTQEAPPADTATRFPAPTGPSGPSATNDTNDTYDTTKGQ